ncbi:conjugative transposon protein TraM [Pedobacter sp. HMF7647]|uniref:Conjugative transposon protein TraM n=1 Tax=Hufsiella arboris TaxID=2695275 RepID=A0A7K1Y781_9SPHI|nr:conjugative transposon protein TraM [Hufsiella arboris]MXV50432.1 conjugative transposon protein TraM [Hufsiella arboris]
MDKETKKKWMLWLLPVAGLPLLALLFYGMEGGVESRNGVIPGAQISASLPEANFRDKQPSGKLGFYERAERDSGIKSADKAVQRELAFNGQPDGGSAVDAPARQIDEKLAEINRAIGRNEAQPDAGMIQKAARPAEMKGDVDRLEDLMTMLRENGEADPEISQLGGLLDKIMQIQRADVSGAGQTEGSQKDPLIPRDTAFQTVPAVVSGAQRVSDGEVVCLALADSVRTGGLLLPKGQLLYGACRVLNQRVLLDVRTIRVGDRIVPVDLAAFDLDGMEGLAAPEAVLAGLSGQLPRVAGGFSLSGMDASAGGQALQAGMEAARSLLERRAKPIRVRLEGGKRVLLRDKTHGH